MKGPARKAPKIINLIDRSEAAAWAAKFFSGLRRPCAVLLSGPMGAGKTQFVRWFLEASRIEGAASPTFAVHHRYDAPAGPVDHLDLYRVGSDDELESSGFWDLVEADRRDALLFVEWADRLPEGIWPPEWHRVRLNLSVPASGGESRVVEIETIPPSSSR